MTTDTNPDAAPAGGDSVPAVPAGTAAPVVSDRGRRVAFLDVTRAIALIGVVLMNAAHVVFPAEMAGEREPSVLTSVLDTGLSLLISGKARAMLMVLLGVGAVLAWGAVARRGGRPLVTMLRRYVALGVLFGIPHLLVFSGDILTHYAITALFLAPLLPLMTAGSPNRPLWFALGSFLASPVFEPFVGSGMFQSMVIGPIPQTLGFFCVGVWLARRPELSPDFTGPNRLIAPMIWGGLIGQILGMGLLIGSSLLFPREIGPDGVPESGPDGLPVTPLPAEMMVDLASTLTGLGGGLFYLGLVWWLLGRNGAVAKALGTLAPLGRMTLTVYLGSTAVFLLMKPFEGEVLLLAQYALAAGYFVVMALAARWWLSRLRLGPLEWIWRSVTHLRPQELRRESPAEPEPGR